MRKPRCLRFLCALVLRARFWGFRLASLLAVAPHHCFALTHLACPHACGVGVMVFARVGAVPLVGVFAWWVVGLGVCVWLCSLLVFALVVLARRRVCADWPVWGWWGVLCPAAPFAPACLLACSRSGVGLLACAMLPWVRG